MRFGVFQWLVVLGEVTAEFRALGRYQARSRFLRWDRCVVDDKPLTEETTECFPN